MKSIRFRADHPGHVAACHGLRVAAEWIAGSEAEVHFDGDCCSILADGAAVDVHGVIDRLAGGRAAIASDGKDSDKAAPVVIWADGVPHAFRLDWWTKKSMRAFKMWAGRQSSIMLVENMMEGCAKLPPAEEPFDFMVPMGGRFGFDPSAGRSMIDIGFSPNRISIEVLTAPVVELFAAIGLQAWQFRHVGEGYWEYEVEGRRWRFVITRRGKTKAFGWAEEMYNG